MTLEFKGQRCDVEMCRRRQFRGRRSRRVASRLTRGVARRDARGAGMNEPHPSPGRRAGRRRERRPKLANGALPPWFDPRCSSVSRRKRREDLQAVRDGKVKQEQYEQGLKQLGRR